VLALAYSDDILLEGIKKEMLAQRDKVINFLKEAERYREGYYSVVENTLIKKLLKPELSLALLVACHNDHVNMVSLILETDELIARCFDDEAICLARSLDVLRLLHAAGADIFARSNMPVQICSARGKYDMVKYLVENGADTLSSENLCFWLAVQQGHISLTRYLYNLGNVDIELHGEAFIVKAAQAGHYEVVQFMLEKGIDVRACEKALPDISSNGHAEVLKVLIAAGIDIHYNSEEALHKAVFARQAIIVKILVENGANVRSQNDKALRITKELYNYRICQLILSQYKGLAYMWAKVFLSI
jgi:ankyrin repeat protein